MPRVQRHGLFKQKRNLKQRVADALSSDNSVDTDVDAEIAHNLWIHHRMLPPNSRFKHWWDIVLLVLVLYYALLIPLQLAYEVKANTVLEIMFDFVFMADMVINFRTTFYDHDNQIVLSDWVVAKNYLQGWFPFDLMASFPYNLLVVIIESGGSKTAVNNNIFGIFKMPRLFRLSRLWAKLEQLSSAGFLRVLLHITFFILGAHWVGCFWWIIGETSYDSKDAECLMKCGGSGVDCGDSHGVSWMLRTPEGSTKLHRDDGSGEYETPVSQQWLSAFYWSLTTLMKSPWVGPDTLGEKAYASLIVMVGAGIFAILLGNVTAWVAASDKTHAELRDRMTSLHNYAVFRHVPAHLQRQMYAYVGAYWTMTAGLDHAEVLAALPERLRGDVMASIHSHLIAEDCLMLRRCGFECAKALLLKFRPQVCLQKESLLVPGQLCTELYILTQGAMQITFPEAMRHDELRNSVIHSTEMSQALLGGATALRHDGKAAPVRKGLKAERLRFRMVEKPGQIVGLRDPLRKPALYPFLVTAVKLSQLLYITRQELADVLGVYHGEDADHVCEVLNSEFRMCWETLKPRKTECGERASSAVHPVWLDSEHEDDENRKLLQDVDAMQEKVGSFEERIDACMRSIATVHAQTALLPAMQQAMRAIIAAHTPERAEGTDLEGAPVPVDSTSACGERRGSRTQKVRFPEAGAAEARSAEAGGARSAGEQHLELSC